MRVEYKAGLYYGLAALAALAALLLREALRAAFGWHYPYHTVWLAIIFSAWYCGIGPSLLAVAIDAVGIWYWFLPPYHAFSGKSHAEYAGMVGFLFFSGVIVALGESNRRLLVKRERAENALKEANERLEDRVKERTIELQRSNESARRLSARVIAVQDEERRRVGRALHDSLGQYLAAVKINLATLESSTEIETRLISECIDIVQQALAETRTISHLLHPPLLDERGLHSAIQLFIEGFARRSGLGVALELPNDSDPRLPPTLEIALFRAVQEALTNVHRYASATTVTIRLMREQSRVRLEISDDGRGMTPAQLEAVREGSAESGVGIAGMRERLRELKGLLEIRSGCTGTTLIITVPVNVPSQDQVSVSLTA